MSPINNNQGLPLINQTPMSRGRLLRGETEKTWQGPSDLVRGGAFINPVLALQYNMVYPLVNIQKAIENCPFIVDLPIKNGDFQ